MPGMLTEGTPLNGIAASTPEHPGVGRSSALRLGIVATILVSAIGAAAFATSQGSDSSQEMQQAVVSTSVEGAWGESLYECKNGEPSVPMDYANGSWGSIDGRWFIIAANIPKHKDAIGICPQMMFEFPDGSSSLMNQEMIYTHGSKNYYWNLTGNTELSDFPGVWKNEGGNGVDIDLYNRTWTSIFATGVWKNERWFGFYFCDPAVEITRKGIPYILKESHQYDDDFRQIARNAMKDAGVLQVGEAYFYTQSDDCDYVWHWRHTDKHTVGSLGDGWRHR